MRLRHDSVGNVRRQLSTSNAATIHRPIAAVFAFLSDPQQLAALSPQLSLVGEPEEMPEGGFRVATATRWHRSVTVTEQYDPPNRISLVSDEVQPSVLARLLRLRIADRVEYVLAVESDHSTRVTATVTVQQMHLTSAVLMAPLARRQIRTYLRRVEHLIDASASSGP